MGVYFPRPRRQRNACRALSTTASTLKFEPLLRSTVGRKEITCLCGPALARATLRTWNLEPKEHELDAVSAQERTRACTKGCGSAPMIARSLSKTVVFSKSFLLKGIDRMLPAGDYRVVTDEEMIEGISFPVYRRVSTMIFVPAPTYGASSIEMATVDPLDLQAALDRDVAP